MLNRKNHINLTLGIEYFYSYDPVYTDYISINSLSSYGFRLFFTDKQSKTLLFDNNNIGMSIDNKIDNRFNIEDKELRN